MASQWSWLSGRKSSTSDETFIIFHRTFSHFLFPSRQMQYFRVKSLPASTLIFIFLPLATESEELEGRENRRNWNESQFNLIRHASLVMFLHRNLNRKEIGISEYFQLIKLHNSMRSHFWRILRLEVFNHWWQQNLFCRRFTVLTCRVIEKFDFFKEKRKLLLFNYRLFSILLTVLALFQICTNH